VDEFHTNSNWNGIDSSRQCLLKLLQARLPNSMTIPSQRLFTLFDYAYQQQIEQCQLHVPTQTLDLLSDHQNCTM
jgi:hypothetical protein